LRHNGYLFFKYGMEELDAIELVAKVLEGPGVLSTVEFFAAAMRDTAGYVKRARAKLRLTQEEFAERLGLERRTIMRYEQGDDLPLLARLAIRQLVDASKRKKLRRSLKDEDEKNGADD
jgi:DNA-binding XRE family transcriptional regulator